MEQESSSQSSLMPSVDLFELITEEKRDEYDDEVKMNSLVEIIRSNPMSAHIVNKLDDENLPLFNAIQFKYPEQIIFALIQVFFEGTKTKNSKGLLPLHIAIQYQSSLEVIQLLLEYNKEGASTKDNYGYTPLHIAIEYQSSLEVIQLLLENNKEGVSTKNIYGYTPLDIAFREK